MLTFSAAIEEVAFHLLAMKGHLFVKFGAVLSASKENRDFLKKLAHRVQYDLPKCADSVAFALRIDSVSESRMFI